MELLYIYIFFCLVTSITAMYELFYPVMQEILGEADLLVNERRKLTYVVLFLLGFIQAPLLFPICIIPHMGERFRDTLARSLREGRIS